MQTKTVGVLVMSYGTPESMEHVEAYYTHIRHGHPPSKEQLEDLIRRYEAIGGTFPLRENTNRQVAALEQKLNENPKQYRFACYQGLKHAPPFIEEGIEQMAKDKIREAVGVVLAPHYSAMSVGGYIRRAQEAASAKGIRMAFVKNYHLHPNLIDALSERVQNALKAFGPSERDKVKVLFTAHSLPAKILEMNDPYPEQLMETSRLVAEKAGIGNWQFAWQSAGQTAVPWLEPDIKDALVQIYEEERVKNAVICPVGFVSDHLEILYDIDIECQSLAKQLGMKLVRTESLNTDLRFISAVADHVQRALDELSLR